MYWWSIGSGGGNTEMRVREWWDRQDATTRLALAVLLLVGLKSIVWALISIDVPDEHGYFAEVVHLADTGEAKSYTGHIVGVFAYSGAAVLRVGRLFGLGDLLAVRLMGAFFTVVVAAIAYRVGRLVSSGSFVPLAAMTLVGFNPMYGFIGASANSDTMQILFASILVLCGVEMLADRATIGWFGGLLVADRLGAFVKRPRAALLDAIAILAAGLVVLMSSRWMVGRLYAVTRWLSSRSGAVGMAGLAFVVVLLAQNAGGLLDYAPVQAPQVYRIGGAGPELPTPRRIWVVLSGQGGQTLARHLWGYFGLLHVPGPKWFYLLGAGLLIWALAGVLLAVARHVLRLFREDEETNTPADFSQQALVVGRWLIWLLLTSATALVTYAAVAYSDRTSTMVQGRYLLTYVVPLGVLLAGGMSFLVPERLAGRTFSVLLVLMMFVNLWSLVYLILPFNY